MLTPTPAQFEQLVMVMREVLTFEHPADRVLRHFFQRNARLGQRDRALIAETVFTTLRRLVWLRWLAPDDAGNARRLLALSLKRVGGLSGRALEPLLKTADREWLASVSGGDTAPPAVAADLPDWAWTRLATARGEDWALAFGRAMQQPAPLDLRVNTHRIHREDALAMLHAEGIEAAPTLLSPLGIRLARKIVLQEHRLFRDGSVEVQDEGSQLLGLLLGARRGERIGDFCAGAGGKTLLIAAQMRDSGQVYAMDVSEKRLAQLSPRLKRAGTSNVQPQRIESEADPRLAKLAGKLDRVLVDAPCSGLGTLRRNPDLKFRQSAAALAELTAKQARILAAAALLVKPGGVLVYGTCSPLREENQDVVDAFLATRSDFAIEAAGPALAKVCPELPDALATTETLQLSPHEQGTDGFFGVRLTRISR
ncbi:MAG: RsmB/NOP family class I SAM-dependent RNA methyltransferase [Burkholderiales bacterium]|nr:RsmB/NOP family class I SAM-dependent RNA methyltransferase [Burkholderiales bacterium]